MALPPSFLDELRIRTPLSAVIGRRVRLARSGRQWKGCCPFHGEKTPSFYVYDDHYHCFGCGAHGDAIGFVMQSQGAGFMEAVEQLATEAGLEVPKPSPEAAEADRKRHDLTSVLELAQTTYQRRLRLPEGRAALEYLRGRGLTEDTIQRFGLGWSGEGRGALIGDLKREGVEQDLLMETGLLRGGEDGGRVGELFFNRVMFPIRDRRGRVISFGGRTMGDGQPKYLNGPETALFSKRRNLYALDLARAARGASIVVVEGYMDAIALHQAGFTGAVAPLGTALTEEQLEELWRLSPAPVLCFDGDAAGARASLRAAEVALPLLTPERSLKLISLPGGEDPDSFVRSKGQLAFQKALDTAEPLPDAIFRNMADRTNMRSPEDRARLRERLEQLARNIANRALAAEYRRFFLDKFFETRYIKKKAGANSIRYASPRSFSNQRKERLDYLTCLILRHPFILPRVGDEFERLDLPPNLGLLREEIWEWRTEAAALESEGLLNYLKLHGLGSEAGELYSKNFDILYAARREAEAQVSEALESWIEVANLLTLDAVEEQIADARTRWRENPEAAARLLQALTKERQRLLGHGVEDVGQPILLRGPEQ
jgi:DNA primase